MRLLYNLLPGSAIDVHHGNHVYNAYTFGHVLTQFELLVFAALAFAVLIRMKIYPAEIRAVNLDFDWIYRKFFPSISEFWTLETVEHSYCSCRSLQE